MISAGRSLSSVLVAVGLVKSRNGNGEKDLLVANKALAGLKILEYCEMVAGPYCAKLMADLGAEVTKIELPGSGDKARSMGPFLHNSPDPERSGLFLYLNTNKSGVTLDVQSPQGIAMFKQLIKDSDILVEDKEPGFMARMGLDYENLKVLDPRLIMTSITPFGQTGPYKNYKAYHLNTFHSGGEGYMTPAGTERLDRPPVISGKHLGDYESGVSAAGATLVALFSRATSGLGQHIDISKQEVLIHLNTGELNHWPTLGVVTTRATRGYRIAGPVKCQDGYLEFCPQTDEEWGRLIDFIGKPEWAGDSNLSDRGYREKHGVELRRLISQSFADRTREQIYHAAQKARIPLAPFYQLDEAVDSPQVTARGFMAEIDHPVAGKLRYPSAPYRFSKTPWRVDRPAPLLGEHNEDIYCRRLGCTVDDLAKFRQAGVI